MDGKKVYQIEINGIQESVNAVEALNKQLNELESRIKVLEKSNVKVSSTLSSTSSGGGSKSSLNEEEKLAKQIEQIDAKRKAYSKEIYQNYLAAKDVLDATVKDQKQISAQERLQANNYTNTMAGLKQELKDLKTVMNGTDLGDEAFADMTQRANELTTKLKELEAAYGQFGRNVGNYQSAFDGLGKVSVSINGVTREFNNLMQAQKAVRNEMGILIDKGKENTTQYKKLEQELERLAKSQKKLNSAMNDAKASSKTMDDLLDTFESFGALAQVGQGFATLFGFDKSEMEQQIAKLVALQNVLKGIEKIRQQMNTGEGIGGWFKQGSKGIDQFVAKLAGAEIRMGKIIGSSKSASIALNGLASILKGLGTGAIVGGTIMVINKLNEFSQTAVKAGDASKVLGSSVDYTTEKLEKLRKTNTNNYLVGITDEFGAASNSANIFIRSLDTLIDKLKEMNEIPVIEFDSKIASEGLQNGLPTGVPTMFKALESLGIGDKEFKYLDPKPLQEFKKEFVSLAKTIESYEKPKTGWGKVNNIFESILPDAITPTGQQRKALGAMGSYILGDFVKEIETTMNKAKKEMSTFGYVTDETKKHIVDLKNEMHDNEALNIIFANLDKFTRNSEQAQKVIDALKKSYEDFADSVANPKQLDPSKLLQLQIDAMEDSEEKIRKQNELNRKKEIAEANFNPEYTKAINAKYNRELDENLKAYRKSKKQEADQKKKEDRDIQKELDEYRLQLMREGLAKQLKELQNEEKYKRQEIIDSEKNVGERLGLLRQVYNKKELELKRDWAHDVEEIYENMYRNIQKIEDEAAEKQRNNDSSGLETETAQKKQNIVFDSTNPNDLNMRKEYYNDLLKIELDASNKELEIQKKNLEEKKRLDEEEENRRTKNVADAKTVKAVMDELSKVPEPSDADYAAIEQKLQEQLNGMRGELVDSYNKGEIDFKQFCDLIKKEQVAHNAAMKAIEDEYNADSDAALQENLDKKQNDYNTYYQNVLSVIRQKQDEINKKMQATPVKENDWGVVQISRTKEQYKGALEQYRNLADEIKQQKEKLKQSLDNNEITAEDFFMRNQELEAMEESVNKSIKNITEKQKMLLSDFIQSIQKYIQDAVQSFNQILSALYDAQNNAFDKEQEELDKLNEELEKKLDEQEEMVQKHKSAIDSIEDELATARGSRRQHLIDQLNAEMAAEKAAQKQKQKIQKEQEKAQKKQDELEKKRRKAQYERDLVQAIVNGAMAVTYAAMNAWPVPAIPMMALAAATTAAQIAIMASNKPYAKGGQLDGGVAQGKRHKDGGIPVLGGRASIEGGEFITNRITTEKNVGVLDFINSKHKKLTLDDFIDFYGSGSIKKNILSQKRTFADGGVIPTLNNEYGFDDRLLTAFEDYSKRPVVVSVVDINNKQADVRRVQALAGIDV